MKVSGNVTFGALLLILFNYVIAAVSKTNDPGEPLFLTPFIENGEIEKARSISRVGELSNISSILSYSGYITVNKEYNSNTFFWYFPSMDNNTDAPVILWLEGGPSDSGLEGAFFEIGPYEIYSNITLGFRDYPWSKHYHVIFVDNPVGTGFSFTDNDAGYATNEEEIADNLYEFLRQFFTIYHEIKPNDFYITGESYGGKYAPSLAYKIHKEGPPSEVNLKGMIIISGFCDPENMLDYSPYYYQLGIVDRREALILRNNSYHIRQDIRNKDFYQATKRFGNIFVTIIAPDFPSVNQTYLKKFSGFDSPYNYLSTEDPGDYSYFKEYVQLPQVRKALHIGQVNFTDEEGPVQKHLVIDLMKSVKDKVALILDNYKVLFFNGQLDLSIPYVFTVNFLKKLQWIYADEYKQAKQKIWYLANTTKVAGYVHNARDLSVVLVRNAGHYVAHDQPEAAFDLISRFINNKRLA